MKPLNFTDSAGTRRYHRMSFRAWYVVFGAGRLSNQDKITSKDLAERIHSLYSDIDPEDISGVIENYLEQRRQTHV